MLLAGCNANFLFWTDLRQKHYSADVDTNSDGISDFDEVTNHLDPYGPKEEANEDPDHDGLTNYWEIKLGFDPHNPDSGSSIYGMNRAGNGVLDGDESLIGDGVPIKWKISNKLDPVGLDARILDSDGDGFSDAEEFAGNTDPNDPQSHPGPKTPLTIFGKIEGRTNNLYVSATVGFCSPGDKVLFTSMAVEPLDGDPRFVDCTTASQALSGMLGSVHEGLQHMYAWRKSTAGIIPHPFVGEVAYDVTSPKGNITISATSPGNLQLAITQPTDPDYSAVQLRRYAEADCSKELVTAGTAMVIDKATTAISDSGLDPTSYYCYKGFWSDTVGNVGTAMATFPDPNDKTPPPGVALTIASLASRTLNLAITQPVDDDLGSFSLRRYTELDCSGEADAGGTALIATTEATTISDSALNLATPYCYKGFWYDAQGNVSTASAAYPGSGPTAGDLQITGYASQTINLAHTPPGDASYDSVDLRRYQAGAGAISCSASAVADGTNMPLASKTTSSVVDAGLTLNTAYCYKVFWYDAFGNFSSVAVSTPYRGVGPTGGTIAVASRTSASISLSLTVPTSPHYTAVTLRRGATGSSCPLVNITDGSPVVLATAATTLTDTGLAANADTTSSNYCYKVFWADAFGNVTAAAPAATPIPVGTLPAGCCYSPSQTTWYLGTNGVNANVSYAINEGTTQIDSVSGPFPQATPLNLPNFLTSLTGLHTTTVTYTGTPSSTLPLTTWTVELNDQSDIPIQTRVIDTSGTSYSAIPSLNLTSGVVKHTNVTATLDASYDGTGAKIKVLTGDVDPANNPTTAASSVAYAESDIPGLNYSDTNCATATQPFVCSVAQTTASATPATDLQLKWTYSKFDQGQYVLGTRNYLSVDGAKIYAPATLASVTKTAVVVDDPGSEPSMFGGATELQAGSTFFFDKTQWFQFQPAIAMSEKESTATQQVYGIAYPTHNAHNDQFFGSVVIDHIGNAATPNFNDGDAGHELSVPSANTQSMALVSTANSASEWLEMGGVFNAVVGGSTQDLMLNNIVYSTVGPSFVSNRVAIYNTANLPVSTSFSGAAMSPAFTDAGDGAVRHGVAFYGLWGTTTSKNVYLSKIRSVPTAKTSAGYFDAGAYYSGTSDVGAFVPSVPLTAGLAGTASLVKIVNAVEASGANYFYVGYRFNVDGKLYFVKATADGVGTTPTLISTKAGDEIPKMTTLHGTWGQPTYGIAAGKDATNSTYLLGVLYAQDSQGTPGCWFRAYAVSAGALAKAVSSDLQVGTSVDCRFPQLFYNSSSKKFMGLWVDGAAGATKYAEFAVNTSTPALVPAAPSEVVVTVARSTTQVCNFAAQYSPTEASTTRMRIGIVSVETADCTSDSNADMIFDIYKPAR